MSTRVPALAGVILALTSLGATLQAQAPANAPGTASANRPVPRTVWGHPDLQGTWDYRTITPLERPASVGDREFLTDAEVTDLEARATARLEGAPEENPRSITIHAPYWTDPGRYVLDDKRTSLIVDPPGGRIPALTPDGQQRNAARQMARTGRGAADGPEDRTNLERCITYGLPTNILPGLYNNNIHLVQSPTHVAILHEMVHEVRIIPIDGTPHLTANLRPLIGDSRGHWEGDTLVVETTNFSDRTSYRGSSPTLRVVERFSRVDADTLGYQLTLEDPSTWVSPWTAAYPMKPSEGPVYEYACHEGNYGLANILEVARDEEKPAAR